MCFEYTLYYDVIADVIFEKKRFDGDFSKIENHTFFDHKILLVIFLNFLRYALFTSIDKLLIRNSNITLDHMVAPGSAFEKILKFQVFYQI